MYRYVRIRAHVKLLAILIISSIVIFTGCQDGEPHTTHQPDPVYEDPHHHVVDINEYSLPQDMIKEYHIVEVEIDLDIPRENVTSNQSGSYIAFTTWEDVSRIYVEDVRDGVIMEIRKFLDWRPFTGIIWLDEDILVFDQWSNPHYGIHFVADIGERRLLVAAPFPDELPSVTPTPEVTTK